MLDIHVSTSHFLLCWTADCHDICLRISDNLKHCGVKPFIDRECLDNLDSLGEHVRTSRVLFLFLTNHIFQSPWCMMEVVEADSNGVPVIPVLVEGCAWGANGERRFPDISLDVQVATCQPRRGIWSGR